MIQKRDSWWQKSVTGITSGAFGALGGAKLNASEIWLWTGMALAMVSRLLPHEPNFTPVLGMALFSGSRFSRTKSGWAAPLVAMAVSDFFVGWHDTLPAVYLSVLMVVAIGRFGNSISRVVWQSRFLQVLSSSGLFFFVTNSAVWLQQDLYPKDISGLWQSWLAGVPFFSATLISTAIYWGLLELGHFGLNEAKSKLQQWRPS